MSDLGLGVIKKGKKNQHKQKKANVNKASFRMLVHVRSLS